MEGVGAFFAILYIMKKWFLRTKSIMILLLISGVVTFGVSTFTYLYETTKQNESDESAEVYRKVLLTLLFFGFLTMSSVFAILFVYTGEMFPTVIRASSFAICSLGGRFGSLIAPQINKLSYIVPGLHGIVFTILCFCGAYIWYVLYIDQLNFRPTQLSAKQNFRPTFFETQFSATFFETQIRPTSFGPTFFGQLF